MAVQVLAEVAASEAAQFTEIWLPGTGTTETWLPGTGTAETWLPDTWLLGTGTAETWLPGTGIKATGTTEAGLKATGTTGIGTMGTGLKETGIMATGSTTAISGTMTISSSFSTGFGFYGWGYPWYWDYPPYYYPYYYPYDYPYDDAYYGINGSPSYSYRTSAGGADTAAQIALWRRGYYRGPIDGVIGPKTEAAIRSFQADNRLAVTGTVNRSLLQALRVRAPS